MMRSSLISHFGFFLLFYFLGAAALLRAQIQANELIKSDKSIYGSKL
jgi:hypothetical protein